MNVTLKDGNGCYISLSLWMRFQKLGSTRKNNTKKKKAVAFLKSDVKFTFLGCFKQFVLHTDNKAVVLLLTE